MGKEIIFISNIDNLGATVDLSEYYLSKRGTAEFGRYTIAEDRLLHNSSMLKCSDSIKNNILIQDIVNWILLLSVIFRNFTY